MTTYNYDSEFYPPAPFLSVDISSTSMPTSTLTVRALIDTGSDVTVVPTSIAHSLSLKVLDTGRAEGVDGIPRRRTLFAALVSLEKEEPTRLDVLTWDNDFALLGRDAIKDWILVLDGPNGTLTISR